MEETEKNLQFLDHIPIDVLFEILVKLPAKTVARLIKGMDHNDPR